MMFIPYIDNNYFLLAPPFSPINMKPPTLYSILNSIVNYDVEEKTKILDLAKVGRLKIFDFDYDLDESQTKEHFETMILNHFMQRRIGFQTVTAFKLQLMVKINEIMPMYNKMFNLLSKANTFGNITVKEGNSNRKIERDDKEDTTLDTSSNNISERKYSDTPQNRINDIKDGKYVTDYNYDTYNDKTNTKGNRNNKSNTKDDNDYQETITNVNLIDDMIKINDNIKSIYSLIFKDLDCLFYQII